jgi:hypothetical protein
VANLNFPFYNEVCVYWVYLDLSGHLCVSTELSWIFHRYRFLTSLFPMGALCFAWMVLIEKLRIFCRRMVILCIFFSFYVYVHTYFDILWPVP